VNRTIAGLLAAAFALPGLACGQVDTPLGAEFGRDGAVPADDATPAEAAVAATSVYLEAESGELTGFTIQDDPAASGGKYILPPPDEDPISTPGGARAEYTFEVGRAGVYLLWGRLRAPGAENNAFFVTMDDQATVRWQLSTGVSWYWGAITDKAQYQTPVPFTLAAGGHRLLFQNAEPLVGLDRLYVTSAGDVPPGNDTPCSPPNSVQLADGGCVPSCGSHGMTTCGMTACAGQTPLVSYDCEICCLLPEGGAPDGGP
jgi:hypothetical protein